jgi:hypothetical protein
MDITASADLGKSSLTCRRSVIFFLISISSIVPFFPTRNLL